jgi:ATP-dependent DNA ligase
MALLRRCRECETRYVVRTLIQNLRVGANSATVMAALARAAVWHDAEARPNSNALSSWGPPILPVEA